MRRTLPPSSRRGQILAIAILCLLILAILVPVLVSYTQSEARWSVKQAASTTAFHLAEAGVEKGYLEVSLSSSAWVNLQTNGTPIPGYNFDQQYQDLGTGGSYSISITSGPGDQQATLISVGRDALKREVRAVKAVYSNSPLGGTAIYSGRGAQIGGGTTVEWGAIISPYTVDSGGNAHPQFWSASSVLPFDTNPNPPNCDGPGCCQWHSFQKNLPPAPTVDLAFYKAQAQAASCPGITTPPVAAPPGSCYFPGSEDTAANNWNAMGTLLAPTTIYVDGDLNVQSSNKLNIVGALLVTGSMNLPNGVWGNGGPYALKVPQDAWKQYCNDWAFYRGTYDGSAPAAFPGLASSYLSAPGLTYNSSGKMSVYGLLYVGGDFISGGGGGQAEVFGALYALGSSTATANSGVTFYFNADAAKNIKTTSIVLTRNSWQDVIVKYPFP